MAARGHRWCHVSEEQTLERYPNLTHGDFRSVRERLYFLGRKKGVGNAHLLAALEGESSAKRENRTPVGFVR